MQNLAEMPSHFFSCDWGTTSFRLRMVETVSRTVLAEITEPAGVKALNTRVAASDPDRQTARTRVFADYLRAKLIEVIGQSSMTASSFPVVISGMASSTVGWKEVPYAKTPFSIDGSDFRYERLHLDGPNGIWTVYLISGLATASDIMRGEETEIVGVMAQARSGWPESVVILPGTHSKHVRIRDGAIVDFQTFMTGELFEVLATQSLLRVSVDWPLPFKAENSWTASERTAFGEGVKAARSPGLNRSLFRVRTRTVLDGVSTSANSWFLSGLLIGTECVELLSQDAGMPILLAASEKFKDAYLCAAAHLGVRERVVSVSSHEISQAPVVAHARFLEQLHSRTER